MSQSFAKVMISVHCATMLPSGSALKKYLVSRGNTVFLCDQINYGDDFRHLICLNAAQCLYFIAFINEEWCRSRECQYEFNIALTTHNRTGAPDIIPIFLESFDFFRQNLAKYPVAFSLTCNYHGFLVSKQELNEELWKKIGDSVAERQARLAATEPTKETPTPNPGIVQSMPGTQAPHPKPQRPRPPHPKEVPHQKSATNIHPRERERPLPTTPQEKPSEDNLVKPSDRKANEQLFASANNSKERLPPTPTAKTDGVGRVKVEVSLTQKLDAVNLGTSKELERNSRMPSHVKEGGQDDHPKSSRLKDAPLSSSQGNLLAPPSTSSHTRSPSPRRSNSLPETESPQKRQTQDEPQKGLTNRTPTKDPLRDSGEQGTPRTLAKTQPKILATQVPLPPSPVTHHRPISSSSESSLSPSKRPSSPPKRSPSPSPPTRPPQASSQRAPSPPKSSLTPPIQTPTSPSPSSPSLPTSPSPPISRVPPPAPLPTEPTSPSLSPTTRLFRALWAQNIEAITLALTQGAIVNTVSSDGLTPLYIACHLSYLEGVTELVAHGADVQMRTVDGETPIYAASQNGNARIVELLIRKGADYNCVVGPFHLSPLMQACSGGFADVVHLLAECEFIAINHQELQYGMTALCFAAAGGHEKIVSELLACSADPNIKTWEWSTPLLIASANGYAEIVRELCMKRADPGVQDKAGETALHRAVLGGHVEAVLALVYVPAQPVVNVRNNHNATPLFIACALGHLEVVRVLIQVGADMNLMAKHETPLSVALARANIAIVLELLQCGVKHDLEPQLVHTIIEGTCSNLLGNNYLRQQFWFQCGTCYGDSDSSRVCLACALVFHKNHDNVRYHSFTYFNCITNGRSPSPSSSDPDTHHHTHHVNYTVPTIKD